ncbi:MAG: VOC family protein [Pseudomonadota bacterium]
MEKVLALGGVFFRAKDPDALTRWYADVLGIDFAGGFWLADGGPTVLQPFREDTQYFGDPSRSFMLNFRVADLEKFVAQLRSAGIEVIQKPEWDSEFGRYARLHDPEGNPVELWEPGPAAPKS